MANLPNRDAEKARAAEAAVAEIESGMLVGLGTGTTAAHVVSALARRVAEGLSVTTVATSLGTARSAQAAGLAVLDFADVAAVDLCVDGVDEIDPALRAIKGGGGAMLREKIVAQAAARMIAIADGSKSVATLSRAIPIEILPFARASVLAAVGRLGGEPLLREGRISDQGNLLADCDFADMSDLPRLAALLSAIPGLLGHGLFLDEIDVLMVGEDESVKRCDRPSGPSLI
ncbi:ribose-5-phosphate isomerase RpiA [Sphingomonas sp. BIUV-7]|uniref:Ribose-5-phosphate isomerase A n=1 Tax=Sphingomonas natans TaxID=3063330 RepID=A0ABT8Y9P5_9SPHN|nr:ribose-5-phosphate isomerase RpiA [Sphingomonas sp. BIUV-7]MDO6415055.1 ribose-5-phosphate isomerase RpiA [Sphingomonas sp. BIUV-7]